MTHHHLVIQRLPQAMSDPGVLYHIAQRLDRLVPRIQPGGTEAATFGNVDAQNRLGTLGDPLPQAQTLIDQPGAVGQRRGARIVARLVLMPRLERLDQVDTPATLTDALLQGQRETRADQPAPDDRQALHQAACSRAAAISASISATLFGTPPVRISQPFLVTTTSSSMRTPMPRHFLATFWLSAAI